MLSVRRVLSSQQSVYSLASSVPIDHPHPQYIIGSDHLAPIRSRSCGHSSWEALKLLSHLDGIDATRPCAPAPIQISRPQFP